MEEIKELIMKEEKNKNLTDYIFHFNCYKQEWSAIKRGEWEKYINGEEFEGWKNKDIKVLIQYISRKDD